MRCTQHKKDFLGDCMWCGKRLCEFCIVKKEGRKFYCENCVVHLIQYKREGIPRSKPKLVAEVQPQPEVKKRFVLSKDGYFELR